MRVVITGASGNLGTSLLRSLEGDPRIEEIVAVARRAGGPTGKVRWVEADIRFDDLRAVLSGADVLVHLAWLIQPTRDVGKLWDVNVRGTARLLQAVGENGPASIVYASSIGAYSPGPASRHPVDEHWPTHGVGTSAYGRAKAYVERCLDAFEARHPHVRVVRMRPALIFKRESADRVRRLFLGALFPPPLLARGRLPLLPKIPGLTFQVVHADDAAEAFRLALHDRGARGAYNLATDPLLDLEDLARVLGVTRTLPVPSWLTRPIVAATWAARLHPVDVGWLDLARAVPTMNVARARDELGWHPRHHAIATLTELLDGVRDRAGGPAPPLRSGRAQLAELEHRQGAAEPRP